MIIFKMLSSESSSKWEFESKNIKLIFLYNKKRECKNKIMFQVN